MLNFHIHLGKITTERKLFKGSLGSTGVLSFHLSEKSVLCLLTTRWNSTLDSQSPYLSVSWFTPSVWRSTSLRCFLRKGTRDESFKKSDTHETLYPSSCLTDGYRIQMSIEICWQ